MTDSSDIPTPAPDGPDFTSRPRPGSTPGTVGNVPGRGDPLENLPVAVTNRQRIPLAIDPFGATGEVLPASYVASRVKSAANLYLGMAEVRGSLLELGKTLAARTAPPRLIGVVQQPDGTAAEHVQVQFNPATLGSKQPTVTVNTDNTGALDLPLPKGMLLPAGSSIELKVQGSNSGATVQIPAAQIAANGLIGAVVLPQFVNPLPVSILAALQNLVPPTDSATPSPPPTNQPQLPVIKVGDGDDCMLAYGMNNSVDKFPFGVFYRLVEPRASIVSQARTFTIDDKLQVFLPNYASSYKSEYIRAEEPREFVAGALPASPPGVLDEGQVTYIDRVPVEQPISVDGFRDQLMGLEDNGFFSEDETRPMAGTLGLGYVLWMAQRWTFQGLTLGDLVYSLPLAPGEQQQIAVFERTDTARVSESEFFTEAQSLQQRATADTSTRATFDSAFEESIRGRSSFQAESDSSSWGGSLIIVSGGGGSSSSSGSSTQSLEGQRNTSQQAAQTTHSAAESQAAARRSAARTGIRIASTSESQQVTTKVITNHNHTRALTVQYWEVQRLYEVTTAIDGLTLTVLIPLQVIRFMPPGQPATLSTTAQVNSRAAVLARYATIIKHGDVLAQALPRRYRHGMNTLLQFAADPTAQVEPFGGAAQDVIEFSLSGTFVPFEDVTITAVSDRQTRVGPVKLANPLSPPPADTLTSREQLLEWFTEHRNGTPTAFTGALALPPSMNRSNIVGFEISRSFRQVSYTLQTPEMAQLSGLVGLFGIATGLEQILESTLVPGSSARQTVYLTPRDLENALNGPQLYNFTATIKEIGPPQPLPQEQYASESLLGVELPPQPYPVPARQLAPVLRYNDLLEIERMAQHVVRNTMTFSRAVWASMSPDERAVLLEAYTIGVPPGGIEDASQMVPLLNCVENRVLGFFGNSMIMPFVIPQALAQGDEIEGEQVDPANIHEALLAYQVAAFTPPKSIVALPTRGVLGEAVLGNCPSAEKIDLTRFWNWQDSPADVAPTISPVTLPTTTPSPAAALTAPNSLTNLPSLINNVLTAPTPDNTLLSALAQAAAAQKDFDSSLTGGKELASLLTNAQTTANAARADALKTTKELRAQAMATAGNIFGGIYAGNPTAGSSAASSVYGTPAAQQQPAPAPAQQGGGKTPVTGAPQGGTSTPPPGGGTSTPPPGGGTSTPPPGGGTSTPPPSGGGGAPTPAPGPPA
jgi:hypothetical protein